MREFRSLIIIYFALWLYIPFNLFSQSSDLPSDWRGARIVAKDNQTGQNKFVQLYKKVYGVIIGIDLYTNLAPSCQLRYAVKDAKGIEKLLRERFIFDEITALYNSDASREVIMSTLLGKLSQTGPDDAVLIFFAGHGYTDTTQYGELGYLVPYDGSFEKGELYKNISMTQLKEDVGKAIPAKHIFFMIDACYSGLLVMRGSTSETHRDLNYMQKITTEPVRQILTAGGKDEEVLDGGPLGHSVFVGRILQILNDTSDFITASELSLRVKEKVFSDARGMGHIQTPAYGAFLGLGDFVFIPRPDTRYEEVLAEISKLQSQLEEINKQKKEAEKMKSEKEIRESKRKEENIQAKLKIEQLEQEGLQKEKERKVMLEEEEKRKANEELQKRIELEGRKKLEEEKLKQLHQKLAEEDAKLKDIQLEVLSIEEAQKEIKMIKSKINDISSVISQEEKKTIERLNNDYASILSLIENEEKESIPSKNQFETTSDYELRVNSIKKKFKKKKNDINTKCNIERLEIKNKYLEEIKSNTKGLTDQIKKLEEIKYPVEELNVKLLDYDADKQIYRVRLIDKKRGTIWFNSLSISPEKAKELYEMKELLKAKGNFISVYCNFFLKEASIITPNSEEKLKYLFSYKLRSNYMQINYYNAISNIKYKETIDIYKSDFERILGHSEEKHYYYSSFILNDFEEVSINGNKVTFDYATGLMWAKDSLYETNLKKAKKKLNDLNKTMYAGFNNWRFPTIEEAISLKILREIRINRELLFYSMRIFTGDAGNSYLLNKGIWIVDIEKGELYLAELNNEYLEHAYMYAVRCIE